MWSLISMRKLLPVGWEPSLRPESSMFTILEDIQHAQELGDGALIWAELTKENREGTELESFWLEVYSWMDQPLPCLELRD